MGKSEFLLFVEMKRGYVSFSLEGKQYVLKLNYIYVGEKFFIKEIVIIRVFVDIFKKVGNVKVIERVTSIGSFSFSFLISVSSVGGVILSWYFDFNKFFFRISFVIFFFQNFIEYKKIFIIVVSLKVFIFKVNLEIDVEKFVESIMNGDFLVIVYDSVGSSNSFSKRNIFDGMDFDFNELIASQ